MLRSFFSDPAHPLPRLNGWRELALGSLLAAELTWIAALFAELPRLDGSTGTAGLLGLAAGVLGGSYYLARILHYYKVRMAVRRGVFVILIIASVVICLAVLGGFGNDEGNALRIFSQPFKVLKPDELIPVQFWQVLAVLLIFYRGVSLAGKPAGSYLALSSFKIGMLMWMAYGVLNPLQGSPMEVGALLIFLFAGLFSLSAARFYEMSHLRGGTAVRFHRSWLAGVALAIALVLGAGTLVSVLMRGQLADLTRWVVYIATLLASGIFVLVITPFMLAFLYLLPWLEKHLVGIRLFEGLGDFTRQMFRMVEALVNRDVIQQAASWIWGSRLLVLLGALLATLALVLLALRLRKWNERSGADQDGEAILSGSDLLHKLDESLRNYLQDAMKGLRGRLGLRRARRLLASMRIRWVYGQLLELCSRLGHTRHPAVTPLEFLPTLEPLFPENKNELGIITDAYLQVRYGEVPETEEAIGRIISAWNRVRKEGRAALVKARRS
jgi:hypothetical protein